MRDSELGSVAEKLDSLIRLLAFFLMEGRKPRDQMILLHRAGFQPKDIAEFIGTTPHTVSVELSRWRRNKTRAPRSGGPRPTR